MDDDDLVLLDFRGVASGQSLLKVELTREQALAVLDGYMRLLAGGGIPEPVEPPAAPPRRRFKVVPR